MKLATNGPCLFVVFITVINLCYVTYVYIFRLDHGIVTLCLKLIHYREMHYQNLPIPIPNTNNLKITIHHVKKLHASSTP